MEVDGDLEVFRVAEAPGCLLHPLDDGVDRFETGIGDPVTQVGEQVGQVAADKLAHFDHRGESAVGWRKLCLAQGGYTTKPKGVSR